VTDHGGAADAKLVEEITQPHRECAQRVVRAGFRRLAMTEQVWRDDAIFFGQRRDHRPPRLRTARHAMDEQQHLAVTFIAVGDAIAV
jgi:3'-phosphoadenosine 5'-phosphosulfate sulfotransferase (PAPS reductase)/FAD synthetase